MGEMLDLGRKNGIDKQKLANFFSETLFPSPVYKTYGQVLAKQAFEPAGFKFALGLKDMHLVRQTADNSGCRMPLVTLLHGLLQEGIAEGQTKTSTGPQLLCRRILETFIWPFGHKKYRYAKR